MNLLFLAIAVILMCIAHFVRVLRWELFVKIYEKPDKKRLLTALSLGYGINYIIPFKLGDIVKGFFAGHKMRNGKALGLSTVIVDRYLDVFAVGLIFLILSLTNRDNASLVEESRFYLIFFGALLIATVLIYIFRGLLKKLIRLFSSLFNTHLEVSCLTFAWALIWNFKDIFLKINKIRLILYTALMWGIYIGSYWCFAAAYSGVSENTGWIEIFSKLFGKNGVKASTMMVSMFTGEFTVSQVYMLVYMIVPLILIALVSLCFRKTKATGKDEKSYLNLLPQLNPAERLVFLDKYFSNESKEYITNYLKINSDISIIRDYSAGSNATTMLCVDENGMFFRKYAFGAEGDKLYDQIKWIEDNSNVLPLPEILKAEKNEMYCYYDMPFNANAVGMFEFVHSMPLELSCKILEEIFGKLENSIYKKNEKSADPEIIAEYVRKKVARNIKTIKEHKRFKPLMEYETLVINGVEYRNLLFYEKWLSEEYLGDVFSEDTYSVIHGDLTIENIVCTRGKTDEYSYYLIDPNTGNLHDSPFLDLAKLLQSIHGGYEFLMAVKNVEVKDNTINFLFARSQAYSELFDWMDKYMSSTYSEKQVKSIFFHEIIHWLRLMPYKLDKDSRTAPVFYAGLLMVLDDVYNRFLG